VAGSFTALLPVSGALLAVVALGEAFTAAHLAALALALAAIALATRRPSLGRLAATRRPG
jgi:drug/metabolite transporter (DMT)-like permease